MKHIVLIASTFLLLAAISTSTQAAGPGSQPTPTTPAGTSSGSAVPVQGVTGGVPLPVAGSFAATLSGFAPASQGTPITATTGGATGTLPVGQPVVVASNTGTSNMAFCALGATATTAAQPIAPNGGWFAFTVGSATQITCATSVSTTTINLIGGTGLATGTGGGGGLGGGSSSNITQFGGTNISTGTGTGGLGIPRFTVSSDSFPAAATVAAQGSTTSGQTGELIMGAVTTGSPTYISGQTNPFSLDTNGNVRVNVVAGGGAGGTSSSFGAAFPGTGTAAGAEYLSSPPTLTTGQMVAMQADIHGNHLVASPSGGFVDGSISTLGTQADAAWSGSGSGTLIAIQKDMDAVAKGPTPAGPNVIGGVFQSGGPWTITQSLMTSGGITPIRLSALSTTVTAIKSAGGQLMMHECWNPNSSVAYAQIFNAVPGSVTLGTTAPTLSIPIPPTNIAGFTLSGTGIQFGTAISTAATTTAAGSTAPATAIDCNAAYN